jgi:flagellin
MASLNTNVSAMTALQTLTATNKNLATTQSRISTGFRVGEAADNAAYWSIATTMRSDNKTLSTVQDSLGLGAGKIDVAYTGMNAAIEVVDEIKAKLVAALGASDDDRGKIQSEIGELQNQLQSIAESATFSGSNWLSVDTNATDHAAAGTHDDVEVVSSFNRDNSGAVSIGKITINVDDIKLFDAEGAAAATTKGILDLQFTTSAAGDGGSAITTSVSALDITEAGITDVDITDMITEVDEVLKTMTTAASDLGAAKKRVDMQSDFVSKLQDAIDRGVGQLVDADMQAESARLSALQVQQQLGIQSLSIANSNAQNILSLFR